MHITCWSFAIGAVLVNLLARKITEDKVKFEPYFAFNFNENNDAGQYDKVLNLAGNLTSKIERSETKRLLDSSSSI